jgi:hypothetical protein
MGHALTLAIGTRSKAQVRLGPGTPELGRMCLDDDVNPVLSLVGY